MCVARSVTRLTLPAIASVSPDPVPVLPMRRSSLTLLGILVLVAAATLRAQSTPALTVRTSSGSLLGRDSAGVAHWLGLPYAAAPVGELRWRAPQAPAPWSAPRDASVYGPSCMQTDALAKLYGGTLEPISEDCLSLNVWSQAAAGAKRPVLVWIHGGGFTHGSGRASIYDGTRLAQLGAVVVTINYRLGIFGFLAHASLSAESPKRASGHYGFLDQVAALRWVKREISAFGGDPDNVTIFGESAGAFSVGYHLVSPLTRGLFHRAIMESGSPYRFPLPLRGDSGTTAERKGAGLVTRAGATDDATAIATLRALTGDSLLARVGNLRIDQLPEAVDGEFLVEMPTASLLAGRVARVPVIIGSNANESTVLVRDLKLTTESQLDSAVRASYPAAFADRVRALYPAEGPQGPVRAYRLLWTDDVFTATARETARAFTRAGAPVYRYYYTRVANGMTGLALGAFHASEIPFVFGVRGMTSPLWGATPYDTTLAAAMSGAWTRFAAVGDPNDAGLATWPRFTLAGDEALEFGARIAAIPGPRPAHLDALGEILALRASSALRRGIRAEGGK